MKSSSLLAAASALLASAPLVAQPPPAVPQPRCTPGPEVVCGQRGAEDLVPLGSDWVAASALAAPGGVLVVRIADRTPFTVYPAANATDRLDRQAYPDCPGPPDTSNFTTHGLYVDPDAAGPVYELLVVGHGAREAIEVFEIDLRGSEPAATWIGCAIAPDPIGLNSVRALPGGGFVTTNFLPRGDGFEEVSAGATNGELWEWHADSGWQEVPGSEASGANGLELSDDLETIYVAAWGSQSFFRLSRGTAPPERDEIDLGFRIDNIHWARDGMLWGVGQAGGSWKAVKIDPDTLAVRDVVEQPDAPEFGAGTALVEVGDDLWVGSFRGNRIVIIPAP
jgi:hypothetical protein